MGRSGSRGTETRMRCLQDNGRVDVDVSVDVDLDVVARKKNDGGGCRKKHPLELSALDRLRISTFSLPCSAFRQS